MFAFIAKLFGYLLNYIYSFVNNYGIAIIIFSILLKLLMLPISIRQQKALKKNAKIQVQVKELQDKYSNDPTRLNQELVDLYKKENMSPLSGCLESIIQFIIILSMFYLVSSPLTYMKHIDADKINNYVEQIKQEEDSQAIRYKEIVVIKKMGKEDPNVYLNMDFLGLDLSDVPIQDYEDLKVFIIPVLYVFSSFASLKLNTYLTKKKKNEENVIIEAKVEKEVEPNNEQKDLVAKEDKAEDASEEMQKQMTMMMPIMTVSIALIAPLGLALYWLVNNIMMIIERLVVNKLYKEGEEE